MCAPVIDDLPCALGAPRHFEVDGPVPGVAQRPIEECVHDLHGDRGGDQEQ